MFGAMGGDNAFHQSGSQLSVRGVGRAYFMAGCLDGTGFMNIHMAGMGGNYSFIGLQQRFNYQHIGLGTAYQKMNCGIRGIAEAADGIPRCFTARIQSIADSLFQVGLDQRLQYLGMGTFAVVITETIHTGILLSEFVMILLLQ